MAVDASADYNAQVPKRPANVKGSIVRSRLDVLRGRGIFDEVMALLPPADRAVWAGLVLPTSWYSFEMSQRLDVATANALGRGDARRAYLELGRASADANLTGVHKAYVRAGNPHHLLSCAPQIYKQYYDQGHRTYEQLSPTSGVLKTFEAESVTANDCLTVVGWHERAIELCGGKQVRIRETHCRARGDDHCEYVCSWRI
ncbi:MAG TPA: TIGR02265 family protein [Polyangia bacterium]